MCLRLKVLRVRVVRGARGPQNAGGAHCNNVAIFALILLKVKNKFNTLKMHITVHVAGRSRCSMRVAKTDTVSRLMEKIQEKFRIQPSQHVILFGGAFLKDDKSLSDCNVVEGSYLSVVRSVTVVVEVMGDREVRFRGTSGTLIKALKTKLQEMSIVTAGRELHFCGRLLEDHETFADYNITEGSRLILRVPNYFEQLFREGGGNIFVKTQQAN
eukprot:TRINITY_DN23391_c0_g1_i2.p1 TRINITY_DN23391_c0_g1~~TRINITY_DN23391_c0_g1_i2.p1  ORF type:complete len:214 (+),score=10.77 TRINITY_DN23391_c0_g1_i2:558-1199(+)